MSYATKFFAGGLLVIAIAGLSFTKISGPVKNNGGTEHYSVDQLPEAWKANKSLIRAIDLILPPTVKELENSVACTNCSPGYSVDILIDSPIIIRQVFKDISERKKNDGFNYECETEYAYKSSLAVYDANKHGVSKVQVTDPLKDEFRLMKKFNFDPKKAKTVEEFAAANPIVVGPSQQDLLNQSEKSIYTLRDEVQKLIKRRL